jgi:hypothetical protein
VIVCVRACVCVCVCVRARARAQARAMRGGREWLVSDLAAPNGLALDDAAPVGDGVPEGAPVRFCRLSFGRAGGSPLPPAGGGARRYLGRVCLNTSVGVNVACKHTGAV